MEHVVNKRIKKNPLCNRVLSTPSRIKPSFVH